MDRRVPGLESHAHDPALLPLCESLRLTDGGRYGQREEQMADAAALSPETVMRQMKQNGVTDIVWLPDSETNWLFLLMQADPDLRLVGVTREGHACSIAAGLFAGGRKPMMLIQNTGMMESGDSIRAWQIGWKLPIVLMSR